MMFYFAKIRIVFKPTKIINGNLLRKQKKWSISTTFVVLSLRTQWSHFIFPSSRYNTLFHTDHGEVKETRDSIIFQLRLRKHLGKATFMALLREEQQEQQTFIKKHRSRKI